MTWTGLHVTPTYKYLRHFLHVNVYTNGKICASFVDPDDGCLPALSILAELLDVTQQNLAQPHPDRATQTEVCDCFLSRINIRYRQEARKQTKRFSPSGDFLSQYYQQSVQEQLHLAAGSPLTISQIM